MKLFPGQLVYLKEDRGSHKAGSMFRVVKLEFTCPDGSIYEMRNVSTNARVAWYSWRMEPVEERPIEEQIAELLG